MGLVNNPSPRNRKMKTIQDIQFDLIRRASFNELDGVAVVKSLKANEGLWRAVIIDRNPKYWPLLKLRDLQDNQWNVDTLFILPVKTRAG